MIKKWIGVPKELWDFKSWRKSQPHDPITKILDQPVAFALQFHDRERYAMFKSMEKDYKKGIPEHMSLNQLERDADWSHRKTDVWFFYNKKLHRISNSDLQFIPTRNGEIFIPAFWALNEPVDDYVVLGKFKSWFLRRWLKWGIRAEINYQSNWDDYCW